MRAMNMGLVMGRQGAAAAGPTLPSYASWTGPGWFDASAAATVDAVGVNKRSGGGDLLKGGDPAKLAIVTAAQNGLNLLRVTRDVTGTGTNNTPRLIAADSALISTMFAGNDVPWSIVCAYKPTSADPGYLFSASLRVGSNDWRGTAVVTRNTPNCTVRKHVGSTDTDANFTAHATSAVRVLGVSHTGTAVTVWNNSATTKALNAAANDSAAMGAAVRFMLFSSFVNGDNGPFLVAAQRSLDFYEIVVENTARSDADMQQAITDMAAKWGITLS